MKRGVLVWLVLPWVFILAGCQGGPTPPPEVPPSPTPAQMPTLLTPELLTTPTQIFASTATVTPLPSPTATLSPTPAAGRIQGRVWADGCPVAGETNVEAPPPECKLYAGVGYAGDGVQQPGELGLAGVVVQLAQGPCPGTPLSQTVTDALGQYVFANLPPGQYCVSVDPEDPRNQPLLNPGIWTQPLPEVSSLTVQVEAGQIQEVHFGRTFKPLPTPTPSPTLPPQQTPVPTQPTPTSTPERPTNPYELGDPDILDTLDVPGRTWYLRWSPEVLITGEPGRLVMEMKKPQPFINYWTFSTYPPIGDGYVEATFITDQPCRGRDRYGLIVRAPTRYEGVIFLIGCNGMYKVIRWNGGLKILQDWTRTPAIHVGPRQVNRIGVWMEGETLKLYINRALVVEVVEEVFREGSVGVVIGSDYNMFKVYLDQFAIWRFP